MTAKETARTALASLDLSKLVETEGDRVAAEVGEVFAEVASAKERLPSLAPVLAWLARATDAAAKDADAAQRALEAERADDAPHVATRDRLRRSLSARLVGVRKTIDSVCAETATTELGFVGATPEREAELVALAHTVLGEVKRNPPKATRGGVSLDVQRLTAGIADDAEALDGVLKTLAREAREESAALVKRDKALRVARARRVGLARALQGLYEFVGDAESAARVHKAIGRIAEPTADEEPTPPVEG
ncbi:MAG: hypothetical protein Q8S73_02425 [Deltaproteobacteria bacterium]|nr:hypothetical protein [Myxococcales bacterium]MDP3212933.1 hypothetical protein [Deltaproteobacteria bacterium]